MRSKLMLLIGLAAGLALVGYLVKREMTSPKGSVVIFGEDSSNLKAYSSLSEEFTATTGDKMHFVAFRDNSWSDSKIVLWGKWE